jgi:phosphate transport system permease protein
MTQSISDNSFIFKEGKIERARWPLSDLLFQVLAVMSVAVGLLVVVALIANLAIDGAGRISWQFFTSFPSRFAEKAGIYSALVGSCYVMTLTVCMSLPLGVGAALYLEEYAPKNKLSSFIELNIANLAGVPSIIYGLLGLQVFVRWLSLERSLISGALTLTILILPVIIISSREAIRTVPKAIREASLALGATKWQTIWYNVLPMAFPGILTGCILAFSRAIGESAPLITLGALTYVAFLPDSIFSPFTVLPIQAYNWVSRPQEAFHANAAAAMLVLLCILLTLNAIAIILRLKLQVRSKY